MRVPLYRDALSHSWHLAWKHHRLWPLGLFSAVLGQLGIMDVLVQLWFTAGGYRPGSGLIVILDLLKTGLDQSHIPFGALGWIGFLAVVAFSLLFVLGVVAIVSQGALVYESAHLTAFKQIAPLGKSWDMGVHHGWRILAVTIFRKAIVLLLGILVSVFSWSLLFSAGGSPWVFLSIFLVFAAVGMVVSLLSIYMIGYIVIEEYTFFRALRAAWSLFVEHWLVSLEVGVVIFFFDILVTVVLLALFFFAMIPAFISYFFALLFSAGTLYTLGIVISVTLFLGMVLVVAAVSSVFVTAVWMHLFMHMHKTGLKSHILHWLGRP